MTKGLTNRQGQVLDFIKAFQAKRGYPPTVREVAGHFGFRSPRAAHDHIKALERKGYLIPAHGKPRALGIKNQRTGIPLLGRIAAGQPLLAVEESEEVLSLDPTFFGAGRFFALRVNGDSMIGDHIADGDLVILRAQETSHPTEIVAVLIDDEVTLKRLVPTPGGVELRASNPDVDPIVIDPSVEPPRVLGVMVGLVRKR
jgi:repressor LexA